MRLIDAERIPNDDFFKGMTDAEKAKVLQWFVSAPTVDAVEVTRCKDCRHATFYSCKNDACYKAIICEYRLGTGDENFFCSLGEPR